LRSDRTFAGIVRAVFLCASHRAADLRRSIRIEHRPRDADLEAATRVGDGEARIAAHLLLFDHDGFLAV
jgi:hypothetical protein